MDYDNIVIFDGVCNLCNWSVQFIIKHDSHGVFKFASAQSRIGQKLFSQFQSTQSTPETVFLLRDGKLFEKSTAALTIAAKLDGGWKYLALFRIIPRRIRDMVYDWIARNRYRWFGKRDACMVPSSELKDRFL